jgi:deazaflavin-dependent oxidoreductase (nitroreductase family)
MPSPIGNFFVKTLVNSPLHPILGESFAVITLTGRKTGKRISTPINTACVDGVLTVISLRSRTWWRNLRGGQIASLRQAGRNYPVRAEVVEDPGKVANLLEKYFTQFPGYAKYYDILIGSGGKPGMAELARIAGERLVIRFFPL